MASRNGSQALADRIRLGFSTSRPVDSTPNPVVTALAGFEVAFAFPFVERFSGGGLGLGLIVGVGFAASDPAVTVPTHPAAAPRSRPLSDRLRPSPDAPRSLARCAAVAIRVVPGQSLVVFSLRSRRCSYRRRLHASRRNQRPGPHSRWPVFK